MRKLAASALLVLAAVTSACAPKGVSAPIATTPSFSDFIKPAVPSELDGDRAGMDYERGWLALQDGDLKSAGRELSAALRLSPAFYPAEAASGYLDLARKDAKPALAHFDHALEEQANYVSALVGRGQALLMLNRKPEAVIALGAAVAVDPIARGRAAAARGASVRRRRGGRGHGEGRGARRQAG